MEIISKIKTLLKNIAIAIMAMVLIIVIIGIIFFGFGEVYAFIGVMITMLSFVGGIF